MCFLRCNRRLRPWGLGLLLVLNLGIGQLELEKDGSCGTDTCDASSAESQSSSCGCGALKRSDFAQDHLVTADDGARKHSNDPQELSGESEEAAAVIYLEGGSFLMGLTQEGYAKLDPAIAKTVPQDGEVPARNVSLEPFGLGQFEVSNRRFAEFVRQTGYITESERFGWSFGVEAFILPEVNANITSQVASAPWWLPVNGADWRSPNGPGTGIDDVMDHPVSQVSLADAEAFCGWSRPGGRVPSEEEWEFAARGNRSQKQFPWGDNMLTGKGKKKRHRMNVWQSELDEDLKKDGQVRNLYGYGEKSIILVKEYYSAKNTALDGYLATAPVDAYGPQNAYGFYNLVGNVWEWTTTTWKNVDPRAPPPEPNAKVKKGGSFLCNPATCGRYRTSARMVFTADSAASNVGFRCAYPAKQS